MVVWWGSDYSRPMTSEAQLKDTPAGLVRSTAGWFAVDLSDTAWFRNEKFGAACRFEGEHRFGEMGINVRVLMPGQPNCLYHRENLEENFLVLFGEFVNAETPNPSPGTERARVVRRRCAESAVAVAKW